MIYISHRGNLTGKNEKSENSPHRIEYALSQGYDCEIDVWFNRHDNKWLLGHDRGEYEIDMSFLKQEGLWIHAKNLEALHKLSETDLNYFWHQEDDYTLTSHRYIWAYPNKQVTSRCIAVMPEWKLDVSQIINLTFAGVCSDIIQHIREGKTNAI